MHADDNPGRGERRDCSTMTSPALAHTLALVGDRWTLQIVAALLEGPKRFGELSEELGGIAPNVLTGRLRQLERAGLAVATPYSRRPVRLSYALSESGRELEGALSLLAAWGSRQAGGAETSVHPVCGTPLETRLYCPTCERPADEPGGEIVHWA